MTLATRRETVSKIKLQCFPDFLKSAAGEDVCGLCPDCASEGRSCEQLGAASLSPWGPDWPQSLVDAKASLGKKGPCWGASHSREGGGGGGADGFREFFLMNVPVWSENQAAGRTKAGTESNRVL